MLEISQTTNGILKVGTFAMVDFMLQMMIKAQFGVTQNGKESEGTMIDLNKPVTVVKVEYLGANNSIITLSNGKKILNSYGVNVAEIDVLTKIVRLDHEYWDYSVTTGKYRNIFLSEDKKQTEKKLGNGQYVLADLNN